MTREEKIEILEKEKAYMMAHGGDRQVEALTSAIKALEQEPKWIPVSERLPEESTRVLISLKTKRNKKVVRSATYYDDGHFHSDTGDCWNTQKDVELLAWMPLPEPYKAESEG